MDYKEEFTQLIEENRLDDARILLEKHKLYASEEPFYYGNMGWILNHMERYQEAEVFREKGLFISRRMVGYILSWAFHWIGRGISGMDWMLC